MQLPQRQRLVWLAPGAWAELLAQRPSSAAVGRVLDAMAFACLEHWARHDLPLVVTRQPAAERAHVVLADALADACAGPALALGLPAPACWERRRLALRVPADGVVRFGDFPPAEAIAPLLPAPTRAAWLELSAGLDALGVVARVYGSHGWQQLTGLSYLHAGSDLDLLLALCSPGQADAAAALLAATVADAATRAALPRLDGELVFANGTAVAWREWAGWRAGRTARLLVRRRHGAALESGAIWADPS